MGIGTFVYADAHQDRLPPLFDPDLFPGIGRYNTFLRP